MKKQKGLQLEDFVEKCIDKINNVHRQQETGKLYAIDLKKTEKQRVAVLKLTVADLETKERTTLQELEFRPDNVSQFLTIDYKAQLYTDLLFAMFALGLYTVENNIALKKANDLLKIKEDIKNGIGRGDEDGDTRASARV